MATVDTTGRIARVTISALAIVIPMLSQNGNADPGMAAFDSEMPIHATIRWKDPLNLSYVNLDNDQLLVHTTQGVKLWDVIPNRFSEPKFSAALSGYRLNGLDYGTFQNWARLGTSPSGTALVATGIGKVRAPYTILWWDAQHRQLSASLPVDWGKGSPRVLTIGPRRLLVCGYSAGSKVARLLQSGGDSRLEWEPAGDNEVRAALRKKGVIGNVIGFGDLSEPDSDLPVLYDATRCGWEFRKPPEALAKYLDRKTRHQNPWIKPYFLADGRILVSEVSYYDHDKKIWRDMNPPLLWDAGTRQWRAIEHVRSAGGARHRVGSEEPVMSHAFESHIIEFLDTRAMKWTRSRQRLPGVQVTNVHLEPLSNGSALVLMVTPFTPGGMTGLVAPMSSPTPPGRLGLSRHGFHGEISLRNGGLMLVGGGSEWDPSARSEIIDAEREQAYLIPSLPERRVAPVGLELKDGSVLIFGGLPPRCAPRFYFFSSEPCSKLPAQISYRYFPRENRWQPLPDLRIYFTRGYWWQTGNSDLSSQWSRNDARVRQNGDFVWIEGGEYFGNRADELLPRNSLVKRWRPDSPAGTEIETLGPLRKARAQASLIELSDGRLAVIGGYTQLELVALEKECIDCPDDLLSIGTLRPARTTEVLDESSSGRLSWHLGPPSYFGGGKALKLANGRIFKLSLSGDFDEQGYSAEIADAAFTRWETLPPFPVRSVTIRNVSVAGNRVLILTGSDRTVVWNDETRRWDIWTAWPRNAGSKTDPPISLTWQGNGDRVLVRYASTFEIVKLPKQ